MKTVAIVLSNVVLLFLVSIQVFSMKQQKGIETYPYTVIKKYDNFEIRSYEERLFTSVKLSTPSYNEGSSRGFSILAGYIFGGNEKNEKIAMTSPVTMSLEDSMTMMFMVPKEYDQKTLPTPDESQIEFKEEPAKTVAAITFGGWSNDEKIEDYKAQLISALEAEGISYTDRFYFFGYNPPFEMLNRRNEVIVELSEY